MTDYYDLTYSELREKLAVIGEKPSRADIIFPVIYGMNGGSLTDSGLKKETLEKLSGNFFCGELECISTLTSETADKFLFQLRDGNTVESVLMKHEFGYNVCVSTQVGCNMGCKFCASGQLKKVRDLSLSEMTGQLLAVRKKLGQKITGLSIMGIGEPLDNYENVLRFISVAMYQKGFDIGAKHITLSTCGLVPKIYELAGAENPVNLAVSLHAPDDELRRSIMPSAKKYSLAEIIKAARYYSERGNRRITFEYVMLSGVNDSDECAEKLASLLKDINGYVNIIRYNPTENPPFTCSPHERIMSFYDILKKNGIGVTMRRELGASVNAACGQLRASAITDRKGVNIP